LDEIEAKGALFNKISKDGKASLKNLANLLAFFPYFSAFFKNANALL